MSKEREMQGTKQTSSAEGEEVMKAKWEMQYQFS